VLGGHPAQQGARWPSLLLLGSAWLLRDQRLRRMAERRRAVKVADRLVCHGGFPFSEGWVAARPP
jgi:hypothetical protein